MISVISSSMRKNSQSEKVALYICRRLRYLFAIEKTKLIDLSKLNLNLWNEESYYNSNEWKLVSQHLKSSSALVIITPEWDGMASPALKNMFNYCNDFELFHKPALLVSVSAGYGGSYPIAELRMSGYKNSKICYLPDHVLIRHVNGVLNGDDPLSKDDCLIRDRIDYSLKVLQSYNKEFMNIRKQSFLCDVKFKNGM